MSERSLTAERDLFFLELFVWFSFSDIPMVATALQAGSSSLSLLHISLCAVKLTKFAMGKKPKLEGNFLASGEGLERQLFLFLIDSLLYLSLFFLQRSKLSLLDVVVTSSQSPSTRSLEIPGPLFYCISIPLKSKISHHFSEICPFGFEGLAPLLFSPCHVLNTSL